MANGLEPYQRNTGDSAPSPYIPAPYQPSGGVLMTDQRTSAFAVVVAWTATLVTFGYMLPWAIAASRGKSNATVVALLNLFLGWTLIGWFAALIMACGAHRRMYAGGQTVNVIVAQQHHPQSAVTNTVGTPPSPPAGWYSAPDGLGARQFWDGQAWTAHRQA